MWKKIQPLSRMRLAVKHGHFKFVNTRMITVNQDVSQRIRLTFVGESSTMYCNGTLVQKDCSKSQHLVQYSPNIIRALFEQTGEVSPQDQPSRREVRLGLVLERSARNSCTFHTHQTTYSENRPPSNSKGQPSPLQPEGGQSIQPVKQPEQPVNTTFMPHMRLLARRGRTFMWTLWITLRITRTLHAMFECNWNLQ